MALPMYALATIPLITRLNSNALQIWYADDAAAVGKISSQHECWNKLSSLGPSYGYFTNASKTWLIIKKEHLEAVQSMVFQTEGTRQHHPTPCSLCSLHSWIDLQMVIFHADNTPHKSPFLPLETIIRTELLPALIGEAPKAT